MNIEKKAFDYVRKKNGSLGGHITLKKLAIPETVKVTLLGEEIIPEAFDLYGHPEFTAEQYELYCFKEKELIRQKGGEHISLKPEITYEEQIFDVPRNTFDTVEGIEKSLSTLSDLNEMLANRKKFIFSHYYETLNTFMLFGNFWLDSNANVFSIVNRDELVFVNDVEDYETIRINNNCNGNVNLSERYYHIPTPDAICPCCCRAFTIDDVRNNSCIYVHGKFYHDKCYCNYRRQSEIAKCITRVLGMLYKDTDYQFELLPNKYYNNDKDYSSYMPWFLIHTIDGDIIIGSWAIRFISIEWQENYKSFNFEKIFKAEDTKKWKEEGKLGILARNELEARNYLKMVMDIVNPGYLEF